MITPQNKQRVEYIDLMKGICIILVIASHSIIPLGNEHISYMFEHLRMPLYFFISGLFFKEYDGFADFTVRKIDKLIIPCLFFAFIFIIPDLTILHPEEADRIFTRSYWKELILYPRNSHLWFLRCLFFASVFYYIFHLSTRKVRFPIRLVLILTISYGMYILSLFLLETIPGHPIIRWLHTFTIFTAITILPFFLIAHEIKTFIFSHIPRHLLIFIFLISILIWAFSSNGIVLLDINYIENNLILFYIAALGGVGCVWCIARWINYIPFISYLGRYSLIILGTHIVFIDYGKLIGLNPWLIFGITIAAMPLLIWFFKRYFPWFTAQRDFVYAWYRKHKTDNQTSQ